MYARIPQQCRYLHRFRSLISKDHVRFQILKGKHVNMYIC